MRLMLLGAPGAGKGTQAELLCKAFEIPKISTGDMLRAEVSAGSPKGLKVKDLMAAGQLVPDDLMNELVKDRIKHCENGYLFDGYPRTVAQAESLEDSRITFDAVIEIFVPDEEIIERLAGRRIHPASGRVYHTRYNRPKVSDQDDETHEPLIQRDDDKPETIKKRLAVYHEQTEPLIDAYKKLAERNRRLRYIRVPGHGAVEDIFHQIKEKLYEHDNRGVGRV